MRLKTDHIRNPLTALLLFVIGGCSNSDKTNPEIKDEVVAEKKPDQSPLVLASLNAIAPDSLRQTLQSLQSFAQCKSPLGKYTTHVITASDGYMYFKQVFDYRADPFEAILTKDSAWYNLGDTIDLLPRSLVFSVRNHAFHNILLELQERFHDFEIADSVEMNNQLFYRVKAKDALGHNCAFYFDPGNNQLSFWQFLNPAKLTDTLSVKFTDWKNTGGFKLPFHIDIVQSGKLLTFEFTRIGINSPDFEKKMFSQKKLPVRTRS